MADLYGSQDVTIRSDDGSQIVTISTDGSNERLDVSLGAAVVDNKLRVITNPYSYAIVEGVIPGHTAVTVMGYNGDVNNTREDIWTLGSNYVFPSTAQQMKIVSSSASDTAAGIGARTVEIHYLDNTYAAHEETLTLNGTTAVNTVATNILRVNDMYVVTAGSSSLPVGNISLTNTAGSVTYRYIEAGLCVSRDLIFTVPLGKTLYITNWQSGSGSNAGNAYSEFIMRATTDTDGDLTPGIFHVKRQVITQDGSIDIELLFPIKCVATTDVKVSAISDGASVNAKCMTQIDGWLE